MSAVGGIIFISLLIGSIFFSSGFFMLKTSQCESDRRKGLIIISLGIGFTIAFLMWGINRNNCMNGSSEYGEKSMTYSNGKVHYYTPRTSRAIYCDDTKGYTFGYVIKYSILISGLSFVAVYVYDAKKEYRKYIIYICSAIGLIALLSTLSNNSNIQNKTEEFIQLDKQCCVNNNGKYYDDNAGEYDACDLARYKDTKYGKHEYTDSRIDEFKAYSQCRQNAIDSIFEKIDRNKVDIDFYL